MSLWHQRRHQVYTTPRSFTPVNQLPTAFVSKFDEFSLQNSPAYNLPSHSMFSRTPCYNALSPAPTPYAPPTDNLRFIHNQSRLPSAVFENSIRRSNYRTTGAEIEPQFSYPTSATTHQVSRYDDFPQIPPYQQSVEMKSFHRNDNAINNGDTSQPTTINSIYSYRVPGLEEQPPFVPSYLRNNQPLETHNYKTGSSRASETFSGVPLITPPVAVADSLVRQSSRVAQSSELLLKSHPVETPSSEIAKSTLHLSDGDEESDGERPVASRRNMRRSDSISDDTYHARLPFTDTKDKADQRDFIDNLHSRVDKAAPEASKCNEELRGDVVPNANMHQVWEKIVEPVQTSFVIPKIIVDTQIDLTEATTLSTVDDSVMESHASVHGETLAAPSIAPSHLEIRDSGEEEQQSEALSSGDATINNNSPLAEAAPSSIYHYDKQPIPDEQQSTRVERAVEGYGGAQDAAATLTMTYESDSMANNSSEGISDDGGGRREAESINNLVDDENQGAPSVALNDKINEIYRKIEKIEGNYYGEKEKIMEHSERRPSVAVVEARNEEQHPEEFQAPDENAIYGGGEWTGDQYQNEIAPVAAWIEPDSQGQPDYASYGGYPEGGNQQTYEGGMGEDRGTYEGAPGEVYSPQYQLDGQQPPQSNEHFDAGAVQTGYENTEYPYEQQAYPYQQQQSEFVYADEAGMHQQQEANNYDPSFLTQSDPNYQQNNYHEAPENPSNYTNDTAGVYYDYDQQPATDPQTMYSDPNYSHHQSAVVDGDASQYFYENDENKAGTYPEYSTENNYGYAELSGDNGTPYNAEGYRPTGDGTYDDVANLQTTNETTLEHANYDSQHFEQPSNENFERDESYLTTADESSESSKPLETDANVNENAGDDGGSAPSQPSKRDDVKLVKQLLDSESDDTTSRSNLLKTSIKEETDESDFDFSAS